MKKFCLTIAIIFSCLAIPGRMQGQSTVTNLDQIKLMQQLLGEWQLELAKDTLLVFEMKQFGDAFLETDYFVTGVKKSIMSFWSYSYNPEESKFRIFVLNSKGKYDTYIGSFISEKEWIQVLVPDFASDKILSKGVYVLNSSTEMQATVYTADGKIEFEGKFVRLK